MSCSCMFVCAQALCMAFYMERKRTWTAGWFLFGMSAAVTIAYFITETYAPRARLFSNHLFMILVQVVVFFAPLVVWGVLSTRQKQPIRLRITRFSTQGLMFIICSALAVSILSLLINILMSTITNNFKDVIAPQYLNHSGNIILALFALVLIPAIVEEFLFRGAVLSVYEQYGTGIGIFLSALAFAMLHGSFNNFLAPFICGLLYAYMAYTLDSIWPAILGHLVNNTFTFLLGLYASAGHDDNFWTYFLVAMLVLFIALCYFATRFLETLIRKGKIKRFNKRKAPLGKVLFITVLAPGFLLFVGVFLFRLYLSVLF